MVGCRFAFALEEVRGVSFQLFFKFMSDLQTAFGLIEDYAVLRKNRRVFPDRACLDSLKTLPQRLPEHGIEVKEILGMLHGTVAPATVMTTGPRYFGFVTGGSLPAAEAAHLVATAWDQNTALQVMSPGCFALEETALGWIAELLHIPAGATGAFVTGALMANFTGMAAARHALLKARGYDVEAEGLFGAPAFAVVVSEESHSTLFKALAMLGLGRDRVIKVPTDGQGRMDPRFFPSLGEPALICLQAGNVNTGAMDSGELIELARQSQSWVHVDGAFGLWGAAAEYAGADSWATDGHKWLNLPYDNGIIFVRDTEAMVGAMSISASYLNSAGGIEPMQKSPESSRRARGVDAWAGLLSLGVSGVKKMIEDCCTHARHFARELERNGLQILNEVSLNQVLVALEDDERTMQWIAAVQAEGVCWVGSTLWHGKRAMRISVSSYSTETEDVERSIESMLRCQV